MSTWTSDERFHHLWQFSTPLFSPADSPLAETSRRPTTPKTTASICCFSLSILHPHIRHKAVYPFEQTLRGGLNSVFPRESTAPFYTVLNITVTPLLVEVAGWLLHEKGRPSWGRRVVQKMQRTLILNLCL